MELYEEPAYVVAVGTQPLVWAVTCDICDDIVSIETEDGDLADKMAEEHNLRHKVVDKDYPNRL